MQHLCMFITGFLNSISYKWIYKILFFTTPQDKKIHPNSYEMISSIKNSIMQILILLLIPQAFYYVGYLLGSDIFNYVGKIIDSVFFLLTFGWFFFYNDAIINSTRKIRLWADKYETSPFGKLYHVQKHNFFNSMGNNIKSLVFLILYYTPIYLIQILILVKIPIIGTILLVISQSFFNSAFYFLKLWPYDKYNIGFIERQWGYMIGYGFLVSLVCNVCLSGALARGAYFLISQWLIINCILYSPPQATFQNVSDAFLKRDMANWGNAYNNHRQKIRQSEEYRAKIVNQITLMKPAMIITDGVNNLLSKLYN